MDKVAEIQRMAYYLWEAEGCPLGRNLEHWLKAEAIYHAEQAKAASAGDPGNPGPRTRTRAAQGRRPKLRIA